MGVAVVVVEIGEMIAGTEEKIDGIEVEPEVAIVIDVTVAAEVEAEIEDGVGAIVERKIEARVSPRRVEAEAEVVQKVKMMLQKRRVDQKAKKLMPRRARTM